MRVRQIMSEDHDCSGLPPGLYLVATPIGAARDITLRALDILRSAAVLAAEDTRRTRRLLSVHGIQLEGRPLIAYHDHSGSRVRERLLRAARKGASVALVSDAGTPLVSDPGYRLVQAFREVGMPIHQAPGASAVLAALAVAGQPTDRFLFAGFPPARRPARRAFLEDLAGIRASVVVFESPKRIRETVLDMVDILGPDRPATLCRELTKVFEEVIPGTLASLGTLIRDRRSEKPDSVRGEICVVVGPPPDPVAVADEEVDRFLRFALAKLSARDAASLAAEFLGMSKRVTYARALAIGRRIDDAGKEPGLPE